MKSPILNVSRADPNAAAGTCSQGLCLWTQREDTLGWSSWLCVLFAEQLPAGWRSMLDKVSDRQGQVLPPAVSLTFLLCSGTRCVF